MRGIVQSRSRTTLALIVGTTLLAAAPFGVAIGAANAGSADPPGDSGNDSVCQPQSDQLDPPNATTKSLVYTAPTGYLISAYCVKAGSAEQAEGPHYVTLNPPVASVTITHPSGKDISHYTVTLVAKPTQSTPPTTTATTTTTPPTTTATTTTTPPTTTATTTTTPPTTTATTTTTTPPTTTATTTVTVAPTTAATTTSAPPVTITPSVTPTTTISVSVPTPVTEVKGDQVKDEDKQPVEVLGEQAVLPTQVSAGLAGDPSTAPLSTSQLWLAGLTGLLAAAIGLGLLSSRRMRGRA